MQSILVIFQATQQETEGLALAFALGAVQAGANIRLRHLDPSPSVRLAHAGYGTLRTEDLRWAEGIAILLESAQPNCLEELTARLSETAVDAEPTGKWAYLFQPDLESETRRLVQSKLHEAGFRQFEEESQPVASVEYMTHMGQRLAGLAAMKS